MKTEVVAKKRSKVAKKKAEAAKPPEPSDRPKRKYDTSRVAKAKKQLDAEMKRLGYVTFDRAAERAKVTVQHIYNLRHHGRIPDEALTRRKAYVYLSVDWVDSHFGL